MENMLDIYKQIYELDEKDSLKLAYDTGKFWLEFNKNKAKLGNKERKIIHKILQKLEIDYEGMSDTQKCRTLFYRYKDLLKELKNKPQNIDTIENKVQDTLIENKVQDNTQVEDK